MLFFWTFSQVSTKILSSAVFNIKKMFLEHQIRMISEGSRDTEDWGNDAEKSALPSQEKITLYIQIENSNFEVYISQYYCLFY